MKFKFVSTDFSQSATMSPTKSVPFMKGENLFLTDSSSILFFVRNRNGRPLFNSAEEANLYYLATTALDTGINLFLLEKDGLTDSPYLNRQKERMHDVFQQLERDVQNWDGSINDSILRVACLLTWVQYRNRYDFSSLSALKALDEKMAKNPLMRETAPPPIA